MQIETHHILLWIIPLWFISRDESTLRLETVYGKPVWRSRPFFAFLVFAPVFLMTVYGRVRSDTWLYLQLYRNIPADYSESINYIVTSTEPGFAAFSILINRFFGANETAFRFIIALVQTIPVVLILRRYSEDYVYSIFMFVALTYHISWMMNGLRQFMAVAIIFAATPWIIRRDTIKTVLLVLFASLFHRSALFIIPVIFLVRGEVWNWKTTLFSFLTIVAIFFLTQSSRFFDEFADSIGFSLSYAKEMGDDGTNPIRVLINAVPMSFAFVFREGLRKDNDPVINLCVNMSVITTGIYLISMVTSGIMVGRMPIYSSLYNLILLPYLIHHCFSGNSKKIVYLGSIVFYCAHLYVEIRGI